MRAAGAPQGNSASDLFEIARPEIDWVKMADAQGVEEQRAQIRLRASQIFPSCEFTARAVPHRAGFVIEAFGGFSPSHPDRRSGDRSRADRAARLPRSEFDVIPPAERVLGTRGHITVWQTACRVGPAGQSRRRIVDIAVQEWLAMGLQTVDATQVDTRLVPDGLIDGMLNPVLRQPRIEQRYPRLGIQDEDMQDDATIAGYWSATPEGRRIVAEQNRAWNAPGGNAVSWVEPWSAAFISWVMCEAGWAIRHNSCARPRISPISIRRYRARDGMAPGAAYVAYDAGEAPINPGRSSVQFARRYTVPQTGRSPSDLGMNAATHCDVVVKIDERNRRVLVIGGNVLSSVEPDNFAAAAGRNSISAPGRRKRQSGRPQRFRPFQVARRSD